MSRKISNKKIIDELERTLYKAGKMGATTTTMINIRNLIETLKLELKITTIPKPETNPIQEQNNDPKPTEM